MLGDASIQFLEHANLRLTLLPVDALHLFFSIISIACRCIFLLLHELGLVVAHGLKSSFEG